MSRLRDQLCTALQRQLAGEKARPPEASAILWNAFMALSRARSCGPVGPNPISYSEIAAWVQLTRTPLAPHQVETIAAMDAVWMEIVYSRTVAPEGVKTVPRGSGQALSPEMFDLAMG